jgi:hypothetical protein
MYRFFSFHMQYINPVNIHLVVLNKGIGVA